MPTANTAVSSLYRAHASELQRFIRRRVGCEEAEDLVQDAYLHMLRHGCVSKLQHPRAYLFKIAANLSVDELRRAKVRSIRCDCKNIDLAPNGAEGSLESSMEVRQVLTALNELPPHCRAAFLLNRVVGLSYIEIAARLRVSVRTIDRYLDRAGKHVAQKTGRKLNP